MADMASSNIPVSPFVTDPDKFEMEEDSGEEGYSCSPNWEDRCRNANPRSKCNCACGGANHGANRPQDR